MKKKLLMYFLMLMLAFSFTACSGDDDDSSSKRSERDKDDEDDEDEDDEDEDEDDKKDKDKDKDDEDEKSEDEDEKSEDEDGKSEDEDEKSEDEDDADKDEEEDNKKPSLSFGDSELSDNLFDYQFSVNGEVYALPMWFSEFEDLGWEYDNDRDYVLASGDYEYDIFMKDGVEIWVDIENYSINSTAVKDCLVTCAEFDLGYVNEESEIKFANDIQLFVSTKDDLLAAYGEPSDIYEGGNRTYFYYYEDDNYNYDCNYTFSFENETGIIDIVEISHAIEVEGFDNTINTEVPEFLHDYEAPTELGKDLFDTTFTLEGDYYALPCPISEFFNNGYEIASYYEYEYIPAGNTYYLSLERDNKSISVSVTNFADYATIVENCYVTSISYNSIYDDEWDFVFAGGITIGSSTDELKALFGEYEYSEYEYTDSVSYSVYENTWEYSNNRYFDTVDDKITYMSIQCDKSPVEE